MIKLRIFVVTVLLSILLPAQTLPVQASAIEYYSPVSGAKLIPTRTTLTFRFGQKLNSASLPRIIVQAQGSASGSHSGQLLLSDDQKTVIFRPDQPFTSAETVQVSVSQRDLTSADTVKLLSFPFTISPAISHAAPVPFSTETIPAQKLSTPLTASSYLTTPGSFPVITLNTPANGTADGDLFLSNFQFASEHLNNYLLILDNQGEPVYYQKVRDGSGATDFKRLPNGNLSYIDLITGTVILMDTAYRVIDTITPGNGYTSVDIHEFLQLPNGHFMFLIYDPQPVDMSAIVPCGNPQATVIGAIVQELDAQKNVVFQWRSWDHYAIQDTNQPLTNQPLDYVHANAIELDLMGNILLSSRHLDEITKIDHQTGEILWRLGGFKNQFTFASTVDPSEPLNFYYQHDIRYLPNGHLSLFDNHNANAPQKSRALEYVVDESTMTATLVSVVRNNPDIFSFAMGNAQRLSNGNTLIGWGANFSPTLAEYKPDGSTAFALTVEGSYYTYRAYRFPWHGYPTWSPDLVVRDDGSGGFNLTISWNGATEVASYQVYGANTQPIGTLITLQAKSGFETTIHLTGSQAASCIYRVMPLDAQGKYTQFSNLVYNPSCVKTVYMPFVSNE